MAAAARDDDGDREKSSFRWLDAVRYVVASVVVVLIVAVAANAVQVVLRPETLVVLVHGGSVSTERFPAAATRAEGESKLRFSFNLRFANPSGRAQMYYYNVTAYLFDNSSATPATESRSPRDDCLVLFGLQDISVPQMGYLDRFKTANESRDPNEIMTSFFDRLNKPAARVDDVTMRVDGTLVSEPVSGFNTTPKRITYYCRHLVVGLNPDNGLQQLTDCTTS